MPGKNTRLLEGKSLVAHAVSKAVATTRIDSVMVSTDSEEIAMLAKQEGAEVPFLRPESLAQDTSAEWDVWKHTVEYLKSASREFKALVVVPPTAPLRLVKDIDACLDLFESGRFDIVITVTDASRNPYFNMVKRIDGDRVDLVIKPDNTVSRRQDVPEVFDMTTVAYVADPDFVLSVNSLFEGRVGHVRIPAERAIDIDTQLDFDIAKCILINSTEPES